MAFFATRLKPLSRVSALSTLMCKVFNRRFTQVIILEAQRNGVRTATHARILGSAPILQSPHFGSAVFPRMNIQRNKIPFLVCQRRVGFFDILRQKLKEEVEKNEDFRNKVQTAKETEAVKKAADAAAATKVEIG